MLTILPWVLASLELYGLVTHYSPEPIRWHCEWYQEGWSPYKEVSMQRPASATFIRGGWATKRWQWRCWKHLPQGSTAFSKLQVDETPGCFYSSENTTYLQTLCNGTTNCCNVPQDKFGMCLAALPQTIPELVWDIKKLQDHSYYLVCIHLPLHGDY